MLWLSLRGHFSLSWSLFFRGGLLLKTAHLNVYQGIYHEHLTAVTFKQRK